MEENVSKCEVFGLNSVVERTGASVEERHWNTDVNKVNSSVLPIGIGNQMSLKKIIIVGFPHSGTTILRNIISHIDDVFEIIKERKLITEIPVECKDKNYILCKYPYLLNIKDKLYEEYIKIFIIRNPLFVFSSLNERFNYKLNANHSIETYIKVVNQFVEYKNDKIDDLYLIRYEDMFENNFERLRNIFNSIGFKYTDDIFDNQKYKNKNNLILDSYIIPIEKPTNLKHNEYRLYQINQPIVDNNDYTKINLLESQIDAFTNNDNIMQIYPDIKSILNGCSNLADEGKQLLSESELDKKQEPSSLERAGTA